MLFVHYTSRMQPITSKCECRKRVEVLFLFRTNATIRKSVSAETLLQLQRSSTASSTYFFKSISHRVLFLLLFPSHRSSLINPTPSVSSASLTPLPAFYPPPLLFTTNVVLNHFVTLRRHTLFLFTTVSSSSPCRTSHYGSEHVHW